MLGGGNAPAGGVDRAPAARADSFAGSCSLHGPVTFTPPVTNTAGSLFYEYNGTGTCSGTLDGRAVSNAAVSLHHSGPSEGSCIRAQTPAPGHGTIAFATGEVIAYTLDFATVGTEVDFTFNGQRSGTARGLGNFITQSTPPDTAAKCAGAGVDELPMDLTLNTDSPLVSDRADDGGPAPPPPAAGSAPGGPGAPGRPGAPSAGGVALRLTVRPRHVRIGRRTAFGFRVRTMAGHSVPGAAVRFAGRRALAGPTGVATIVATLHRAGRRAARATKPGFSAARVTIGVRRG
jgi:hypothetical protein